MPQPLRVVHTTDPKQEIQTEAGVYTDQIEPLAAGVLLVMYERSKQGGDIRTAGGIIVPEVQHGSLREDKYQGKAGLVMKLGPIAFQEDAAHRWGGRIPEVGDWVIVNVGDTFSFDLPGDRRARIVEDVHIKAVVQQPDVVW